MNDWRINDVLWANNNCTGTFRQMPNTRTVEVIVMRLLRMTDPFTGWRKS